MASVLNPTDVSYGGAFDPAQLHNPPYQSTSEYGAHHPFDNMHYDSDEEHGEYDEEDDQDDDYVEEDRAHGSQYTIPPPIPVHSRPMKPLPNMKSLGNIPVANTVRRGPGALQSRSIILPAQAVLQKQPSRVVQKRAVPTTSRRLSSHAHRATHSESSNGGIDLNDPSIPDPNDPSIQMVSATQAANMTFLDFQDNMFLVRGEFEIQLYPSSLEPPSKLTPLRCLFCKKIYNGPNARSMWRRHMTQKHNFLLGGKKGNGKGRKEFDENLYPGDSYADEVARRREHQLQLKRDYARNRRLQRQQESGEDDIAYLLASGGQYPAPSLPFLPPNPADVHNPYNPTQTKLNDNFFWQSGAMTTANTMPYPAVALRAQAEHAATKSLSYLSHNLEQAASPEPSLHFAHSPNVPSFSPHTPLVKLEPAFTDDMTKPGDDVKDEDENSDDDDGRHSPPGRSPAEFQPFTMYADLASEFDFDHPRIVDTSPVCAMSKSYSGALSQPQDKNLNSLPEYSNFLIQPLDGAEKPKTPGRLGVTSMTEAERRRMILSMESPTSFPSISRSKSSAALPFTSSIASPPAHFITPGRPSMAMMRSVTMPALPTLGFGEGDAVGDLSLVGSTPDRSANSTFDYLPTPFRNALLPGIDAWNYESPVVKRKRSADAAFASHIEVVFPQSTPEHRGTSQLFPGEGSPFDKWFDLPNSPEKPTRPTHNVEDEEEEPVRAIKKARVLA